MSRMAKSLEGKYEHVPPLFGFFLRAPRISLTDFCLLEMQIVVIFLVLFIQHSRTCANVFSVPAWSRKWVFGEGAIH